MENLQKEPATTVVNDMSAETVQELLDLAKGAPIEIVSQPAAGLTMMHMLDAFDSEFLLGEVLVTSAQVELDGERGVGMVVGDDAPRALARACAEVLIRGKDEILRARVIKLIEKEQQRVEEKRRSEERLIASTKVNFELMAGE
jgi:alpha-D-ribose 1-methylphosphonate 5-triphosphate synthase subunit PhnG